MHPYQQQHYAGGPPAPQQRPHASNQLPPMYPGMSISSMPGQPGPSVPGASNVPHSFAYNPATAQYSTPAQNAQPQDQQGRLSLSGTGTNGKFNFELKVEQEPQRARMCGFGDKDRRPLTPPPCIRLLITDLWDQEATREVNIVRSSSNSPAVSISTATTTSYPPIPDRPPLPEYQQPVGYTPDGQPLFPAPRGYPPGAVMPYPSAGYSSYYPSPYSGPAGPGPLPRGNLHSGVQTNTSMYTRNLIGSLTVNASVLKDPEGEEAYWFVLQDLSVRTEGWFR